MVFAREATSKDRLKIDWRHPVPPARDAERTASAVALPLAEALQVLWENDERPLLVLRECHYCQDSDQALLSRSLNNDRTLLLTKWFRVVRLPMHVTEPSHPFYNVFAGYAFKSSNGQTPHFYLLAHPAAQPVEFTGEQMQSSLWKGMAAVLGERYGRDPNKAVKEWLLLLNEFDRFDALLRSTQAELDETRAKNGPKSDKAKELEKRLAELKTQRGEALAREDRVRDLRLLSMPKPAAPVVGAAQAVGAANGAK